MFFSTDNWEIEPFKCQNFYWIQWRSKQRKLPPQGLEYLEYCLQGSEFAFERSKGKKLGTLWTILGLEEAVLETEKGVE